MQNKSFLALAVLISVSAMLLVFALTPRNTAAPTPVTAKGGGDYGAGNGRATVAKGGGDYGAGNGRGTEVARGGAYGAANGLADTNAIARANAPAKPELVSVRQDGVATK